MATNAPGKRTRRRSERGKKRGPHATVKFGSAVVPIYESRSGGRVRYCFTYYREGQRLRQFFSDLDAAKKEARFVAQRIQSGLQHVTDLKPHERDMCEFQTPSSLVCSAGFSRGLTATLPAKAGTTNAWIRALWVGMDGS